MASSAARDRSNEWNTKLRPKGKRIEYPALRKLLEDSVQYATQLLFDQDKPIAVVDLIFAFDLGFQHLPAELV